ncbi:YbjN domain-containing protein [Novosphingobium sp. ZN18A2]|uniref:YbjN domain-containing protein n=1 Tax=Novosphingobium sp. ZN18A2 TaxID=3079861 RepID=UPI0030D36807
MRLVFAAAIAAVLATASPGTAEARVSAGDPDGMVAQLVKMGAKAELTRDDIGDPLINAEINGWKSSLVFYDCNAAHAKCQSFQFVAIFDAPKGFDPAPLYDFPRTHRFAAITINAQGDPRVSWDVITNGGIDDGIFRSAVFSFGNMLDAVGAIIFPRKAQG